MNICRILAQLQSIFGRNWWDGWLMKWLKIGGRKLASMQAALKWRDIRLLTTERKGASFSRDF